MPSSAPSRPRRSAAPAGAQAAAPPRFIDDYLAYLLAQASRRVSGQFHGEVQMGGLSVTEWRVLAGLSGVPHESVGALSEITLTKQPTLSKIIQRMERQGLVRRSDTPVDRRQTLVALTPKGQALASAPCSTSSASCSHWARAMPARSCACCASSSICPNPVDARGAGRYTRPNAQPLPAAVPST